jgi:hypothetical protein
MLIRGVRVTEEKEETLGRGSNGLRNWEWQEIVYEEVKDDEDLADNTIMWLTSYINQSRDLPDWKLYNTLMFFLEKWDDDNWDEVKIFFLLRWWKRVVTDDFTGGDFIRQMLQEGDDDVRRLIYGLKLDNVIKGDKVVRYIQRALEAIRETLAIHTLDEIITLELDTRKSPHFLDRR